MADGGNLLQIREDVKKGVFLDGVSEHLSHSSGQTLDILNKGLASRHIGATSMNLESSRSHSVFSICVESRTKESGINKLRKSQFHFVDLAGSERQKKTDAKGDRLKEGCNINRSLTALGCVINALVEAASGKKVHVRYRDSKLTFLLRDSLGGNSKTAMIANISPAASAYHETLSTLQFAQRAKLIKNRAILNEDASGDCEALKIEIKRLKDELESAKSTISGLQLSKFSGNSYGQNASNAPTCSSDQVRDLQLALDENISALLEAQAALQCEVSRKEDLLVTVKKFMKIQQEQENQSKLVLQLQEERARREGKDFQPLVYHTFDYETALDNILLRDRLWRLDNATRMVYSAVDLSVDEDLLDENPAKPCPGFISTPNNETEGRSCLNNTENYYNQKIISEETQVKDIKEKSEVKYLSKEVMTVQGGLELESEIERLKLELMQNEEERDTLAKSLDYFKDEFTHQKMKLEDEVSDMKQKLKDQDQTFNQRLEDMKKELEFERALREKTAENYLKKISESEHQISTLNSTLSQSKACISEHNSKIQTLDSRLGHLLTVLENKRIALANLKEINSKLQISNDSLQADLVVKDQNICQLKNSLSKATENLNSLSLYANVVDNAIVDLKNSMESQTATSIMEDLISAVTFKQQAAVMRKALMDRDVLISAVRREVEEERSRFNDQMSSFKRDVSDIQKDYEQLSMLVDIKKQKELDFKSESFNTSEVEDLKETDEGVTEMDKGFKIIIDDQQMNENQEHTDPKRVFKENINATNKKASFPHHLESSLDQVPLSEVQNIPSLLEKKVLKRLELTTLDLKEQVDPTMNCMKSLVNDKSIKRSSSEEASEASLGKRQEMPNARFENENLAADLDAKLKWIIESNMAGKNHDTSAKVLPVHNFQSLPDRKK